MKDFDHWNIRKKNLNEKSSVEFYYPREIWWCSIGVNVGSEQDGKSQDFQRPVLIIKGLGRGVCLIAPLTTSPHKHPYRINIGSVTGIESKVVLSQIRVIDTRRFADKIAILDKTTFDLIKKSIRDML